MLLAGTRRETPFARASLRGALRSFLAAVRVASRLRCSVLGVHGHRFFFLLFLLLTARSEPRETRTGIELPGARPLPPTLTAAGAHLVGGPDRNFFAAALLSPV